jgi:DDE superfamily endonuclease
VFDGCVATSRSSWTGSLKGPCNGNPTGDLQVATDRASSHPVRGPLVPAVSHPIRSLGVINTDLAPIYGSAIPDIKKEGTLRRRCRHRPVQYLNNILEQDHRAIKRRVNAKQGFREFQAARRTIQGYEAMHMIRKGQARWVSRKDVRRPFLRPTPVIPRTPIESCNIAPRIFGRLAQSGDGIPNRGSDFAARRRAA